MDRVYSYHSVNKAHLERYLHHESYNLLSGELEEFAEGMLVKEEDKVFIPTFTNLRLPGCYWTGLIKE